jgi:hypothetical protein
VRDWYAYSSSGESELSLTTYHNENDEWFLILPFDWRGKVSVRRDDSIAGERTVIFSYFADDDAPFEDFLKIYKFSGESASAKANTPGRVLLLTEGDSVYALELLTEANSYGLTFDETLIRDNFRLIRSDWLTGLMS